MPTTVTAAPSSARSATGLCATRSARSAATAPAAHRHEQEAGHASRRPPAGAGAADQARHHDRDHAAAAATARPAPRRARGCRRPHRARRRPPSSGIRRSGRARSGSVGGIVAHTVTKGATWSRVTSPMPSTSSSSSTEVKPPCSSRQARIEAAVTGPTSGRVSSSVSVAVLRLTSVAGPPGGAPGVGAAAAAAPGRRRLPHDHLLAVDEDPGQVEPGQVDARPGPAGRRQRVDDPGARVEDGDAGVAHLAGHVDRDRAGRGGGRGVGAPRPRRRPPGCDDAATRSPAPRAGAAASSEAGIGAAADQPPAGDRQADRDHDRDHRELGRPESDPGSARRAARSGGPRGARASAPAPGSGRGAAGGGRRRWPARRRRPGVVVPPGRAGRLGDGGGSGRAGRTPASSSPSRASRREMAAWCSGLGRRVRMRRT